MELNTITTENLFAVISKTEFLEILDDLPQDLAIISISEPVTEYYSDESISDEILSRFSAYHKSKFWDIEEPIGDYETIPSETAKALKDFILDNSDKKFLVHCRAGQSRSAGVAMALECLLSHDGNKYDYATSGTSFYTNSRYCPNLTVYDKILA